MKILHSGYTSEINFAIVDQLYKSVFIYYDKYMPDRYASSVGMWHIKYRK